MPKPAKIEPSRPDAYRPRRSFPVQPSSLLPVVFIGVFAAIAWSAEPVVAIAVLGIGALFLLRPLISSLRADCPVVVDELGLIFGRTGAGEGPRLVTWETVTAVVLFDVPRTDTSKHQWQQAIGAHLVGRPDGVSVYRPLTGWSLDTAALKRAVARFGGGVEVEFGERVGATPTEGQRQRGAGRIADAAHTEAQPQPEPQAQWQAPPQDQWQAQPQATGYQPPAGPQPRIIWHRTARYQPSDPAAYLARHDLRSHLPLIVVLVLVQVAMWALLVPQQPGVGILMAVAFAAPLLFIWRSLRAGGAVALGVDRPGVFFGESSSPGDDQEHRLLPWAEISAVVVYDQLVPGDEHDGWQRAVGVRLRGEPTLVRHWRIVAGWRLDRPALEAAVARFAPGVHVLDGPPQRHRAR